MAFLEFMPLFNVAMLRGQRDLTTLTRRGSGLTVAICHGGLPITLPGQKMLGAPRFGRAGDQVNESQVSNQHTKSTLTLIAPYASIL